MDSSLWDCSTLAWGLEGEMDSDDEGNGGIFLFGKSTIKIKEPVDAQPASAETGPKWSARLKKRPSLPKLTEETLKAAVVTGEEIMKGALRLIPTVYIVKHIADHI